MIYLDTCLLIYAVEDAGPRGERVRAQLADNDSVGFAVSPLVKLECLVGAFRAGDAALVERYRQSFVSASTVPMSEPVFLRAARLRADHALKVPDALHLAAALHSGCTELWTNDHRLARAAGDFVKTVV